MKKIAILGSTGSIGTQTLDVIRANPDKFSVAAVAANENDALLEEQIEEFRPSIAVLADEAAARRLKRRYIGDTEVLAGKEGIMAAAALNECDTVVTSMVGFSGLEPTVAAICAKKNIALANKETLVVAGEIIMRLAAENGVSILPVDSEHSAIFQCLQGEDASRVGRVLLTASGGPFRGKRRVELTGVSIEDCLKHPNWAMGKKITIDCATMANKGLEVIEAKWLYGLSYDQIQVVVHPQSIVHSMVEYVDGAVIAQMGMPDMRVPIQYALTHPERCAANFPKLNFWKMRELTFEEPDMETFAALKLAYRAGRTGGTAPCVFNAANEVAVGAFLRRELPFLGIEEMIERTMDAHRAMEHPTLQDLYDADAWARQYALGVLEANTWTNGG